MELDSFTRNVAWITRWLSSVNTQHNPVVGVMNLAHYLQGASCSCPLRRWPASKPRSSATAGAILSPSTKNCAASARKRAHPPASGRCCGSNCSATAARLCMQSPRTAPWRCRRHWTKLARVGQLPPAATRHGVYRAALDQGISRQEAASIAKNIKVYFNCMHPQESRSSTNCHFSTPWKFRA